MESLDLIVTKNLIVRLLVSDIILEVVLHPDGVVPTTAV